MKKQDYNNHSYYYIPHHLFFYGTVFAGMAISGVLSFRDREHHFLWVAIFLLFLMAGWLSYMLRQHYALGLQNRLVVMELQFRYYTLTQKRLDDVAPALRYSQMIALRFAPDEELVALVDKTVKEGLKADAIKREIKNWRADIRRV